MEQDVRDQFERIDDRFARIDERFDRIDERFDRIDDRFARVDERFARIDQQFARVDERFDRIEKSFQGLERLITDFKDSLEREVLEGFAQVTARFDTQATRLDRHAALWQTGRRWSAKMDVWAERIDQAVEARDREIAELRERLIKLEKKSA